MAQSSYTPILIYGSTTTGNTPLAANLTTSASGVELAVNAADGKLFYKDSGGVVQVLASKAGNINVASFQTSLGGLTPSTATTGIVTLAGTLNTTSGGTGLTSFTAGDLPYYAAGTLLSKLSIGTTGQILTSSGTAPQWSTLSGVAVTTFSAGTTGFTPSSATSGAVTLAGTLATTNGGTGLTSFTANGVVYASSTSALATGSALTFDGTSGMGVGGNSTFAVSGDGTGVNGLVVQAAKAALRIWGTTGTNQFLDIGVGGGQATIGAYYSSLPNINYDAYTAHIYKINGSEQMRLTSTGLGIGTSSPGSFDATGRQLVVGNGAASQGMTIYTAAANAGSIFFAKGTTGSDPYRGFLQYGQSALTSAADAMIFGTAGAERMRLDSAGNLGLGVTPSAWGGIKALQVGGGNALMFTGSNVYGQFYMLNNAYYNGSNYIYQYTQAAASYVQNQGAHQWLNAPSGTAGNPISFTQAMTLDASGRLLVNATSNFFTNSKIQVTASAGPSLGAQQTTAGEYAAGFWNNATGTVNLISFYAGSGGSRIGDITATSNTISLNGPTTGSGITIDNAGNLGLGVTPSAWWSSTKTFQFGAGGVISGRTDTAARNYFASNAYLNSTPAWTYIATNFATRYEQNDGQHQWLTAPSGTAGNAITFTQAMTLDASGNLLIATTTTTGNGAAFLPAGSGSGMLLRIAKASEGTAHQFAVASNVVGSIYTTASLTTYNSTSDHRLKTVIGPVDGSGARIDALQPIEYTWKTDGSQTRGFLAHQFQEVYAGSVTGEKDAVDAEGKPVYQAMQASSAEVIADLVAEMQSLRKRLAAAGL